MTVQGIQICIKDGYPGSVGCQVQEQKTEGGFWNLFGGGQSTVPSKSQKGKGRDWPLEKNESSKYCHLPTLQSFAVLPSCSLKLMVMSS